MPDFETGTRRKARRRDRGGAAAGISAGLLGGAETRRGPGRAEEAKAPVGEGPDMRIPVGSKKACMISVGMELWRRGRLDSRSLPQARGRELVGEPGEAPMQRALLRSSIPEISCALKPEVLEGELVRVDGRLKPSAREGLKGLGFRVVEEPDPGEKRYLDMTPAVFVAAGLLMAVRYLSLGLDSQVAYVFAGVGFALLYALRPFIYKLQRPAEN